MWRDLCMNNAFSNAYEPILCNLSGFLDNNDESDEERKTLEPVDSEFEEKWLKMRKYEYYQRHKDSVDKYGIVEPDMKLSKEEVIELKIYLEQKHYERTFKNTKAIKLKNIDNEHICCAIGKKHQCGVDSKK